MGTAVGFESEIIQKCVHISDMRVQIRDRRNIMGTN